MVVVLWFSFEATTNQVASEKDNPSLKEHHFVLGVPQVASRIRITAILLKPEYPFVCYFLCVAMQVHSGTVIHGMSYYTCFFSSHSCRLPLPLVHCMLSPLNGVAGYHPEAHKVVSFTNCQPLAPEANSEIQLLHNMPILLEAAR